MRRAALLTLMLTPLLACTTVEPDPVVSGPIVPPRDEEIFVSKNDLERAAENLELQAIELQPGESAEAAIQRVLGLQAARDVSALLEDQAAEAAPAPEPEPDPAPAPQPAPQRCDDSCQWANDGVCDDGGPNSQTQVCAPGTDCTDCDGRGAPDPQPEPEPDPQPAPEPDPQPDPAPAPQADPNRCDNTCRFANDGECDDGRPGAAFSLCVLGSDCNDCEGRTPSAPADPAPAEPAPAAPPPAEPEANAYGQACQAGGLQGRCGEVAACGGRPIPGHCPGPNNIQCCVPDVDANAAGSADHPAIGQRCDAAGALGTCQTTAACPGESIPGYCAGPNDIQCCVERQGAQKALPLAAPVVIWGGRLLIVALRSYAARRGAYVGSAVVATGVRRQVQRQVGVYVNRNALGRTQEWDRGATVPLDPVVGPMTDRFLRENARGRADAQPGAQSQSQERGCETATSCTVEECRGLQDEKARQCNQRRSCGNIGEAEPDMEAFARRLINGTGTAQQQARAATALGERCAELSEFRNRNQYCLEARYEVMDECFDGGDADHHGYVDQVRRLREACDWKFRQYMCDILGPRLVGM